MCCSRGISSCRQQCQRQLTGIHLDKLHLLSLQLLTVLRTLPPGHQYFRNFSPRRSQDRVLLALVSLV